MTATLKAASAISSLTLLSRVLGLIRDSVMLHMLGSGWVMGVFNLAWMFPNLLRRLFGEGALSAAFVPRFAATLTRDGRDPARRLLGGVTGALLLGLGVVAAAVCGICLLLPPQWLGLTGGPGVGADERGGLLLTLLAILFPYTVPICMSAIYAGALNTLGLFALPAAAPVLLNVVWIGALLAIPALIGTDQVRLAILLSVALTAGGVLQVLANLWLLRRKGCAAAPRWPARGEEARSVFVAMAPTMLGMSMNQVSSLLDQLIAEYCVGPGANTHVYLANRLIQFPHALTSLALATAVFAHLAVLAARREFPELRARMHANLHGTLFLTVPAALGLIAITPEFLAVTFQHGAFRADDVRVSSWTTMLLVAGLPFLGMTQLYARALYALGDLRTPARVAMLLLVVNLGLNLVFVLGVGLGVPGLTLATSLTSGLNALLLRRRFDALCPGARAPLKPLLRVVGASLAMAVVVLALKSVLHAEGRLARALVEVAVPVAAGVAVFCTAHYALGGRELSTLLQRLRARP